MLSVGQRDRGLRQRPVTVAIGGDGADQHAAVVNAYRRIGLGGAVQRRRCIVGRIAVNHRPGDGTDIIDDRRDHRGRWRGGVHVNHKGCCRAAGVPGGVGGGDGQRMQPVAQRWCRGEGPRAASGGDGANQHAIVEDFHRRTRFRRA
ncbi:hypothetical protein D3C72_349450 [compost metagenome]